MILSSLPGRKTAGSIESETKHMYGFNEPRSSNNRLTWPIGRSNNEYLPPTVETVHNGQELMDHLDTGAGLKKAMVIHGPSLVRHPHTPQT